MITDAIMAVFLGFVEWVVGQLPTDDPPAWMLNAAGYMRDIWGYAAGLGAWIPWSMVGAVLAAVFACMALGLLIKLIRIVASFLTFGGGAAS